MTDEDLIDGAIDDVTHGVGVMLRAATRRKLTAKILAALDLPTRDARLRGEAREAMREDAAKGPSRFITTWRKTGKDCLDWDHYVSESAKEVEQVEANIQKQGVRQFNTYRLGELVREFPIRALATDAQGEAK